MRKVGIKDKTNKEIYEHQRVTWNRHTFDVVYCNGAFKLMETKSFLKGAVDIWLHDVIGVGCMCGKKIKSLEIWEK